MSRWHLRCCDWPGSVCTTCHELSQCSASLHKHTSQSHLGMKTEGNSSGHQSHVNTKVSHLHDELPSPPSAFCSIRWIRSIQTCGGPSSCPVAQHIQTFAETIFCPCYMLKLTTVCCLSKSFCASSIWFSNCLRKWKPTSVIKANYMLRVIYCYSELSILTCWLYGFSNGVVDSSSHTLSKTWDLNWRSFVSAPISCRGHS